MYRNLEKVLFAIVFLMISSCEKDHMCDCFKSTGEVTKELRSVSAYTGLNVSDNVDVFINQGTDFSITVEAGENIIDGIITLIENNTLYIKNENKCNWVRSYNNPLSVYLTVPALSLIFHQGSGDIYSDQKLFLDSLQVELWSSGNATLNLEAGFIKTLQHVSVGDIRLTGFAKKLYIYNNGNAFSYCADFKAKEVQVDQQSTGECYVTADSIFHYDISGIGNVYLYGNPIVTGTSTGKGQLIRN